MCKPWPIPFLINVFPALTGSQFYFYFLAHGFNLNLKKLAGKFPNNDRLIISMAITMALRKTHLSKSHKHLKQKLFIQNTSR